MDEFRLVVVAGPLMGRSYVVQPGERHIIGRASAAEIQLKGSQVSRQHAELSWEGETLLLSDLGSRNGTALNMQPVAPNSTVPLSKGQVIKIGKHALLVDTKGSQASGGAVLLDAPQLSKRYKLEERIGRGSQANVWIATDTQRGRKVAVKILRGIPAQGGEEQERFLREGKICCQLDDPHLVRVYEFALPRFDPPYMVMEFIEGTNAWVLCRQRFLSIQEALLLGIHLARALVAIGAAGIVHRDVKPMNLLVTNAGLGKLTDFGIAKVLGGPTLTQTGWGMGSLPFAPPEQAANAKDVDARADTYGLGATLYSLLSGRPPFLGNPTQSSGLRKLLRAIEQDPPSPLEPLRPDIPPELARFVEADLLAKAPEDRPPSAVIALTRLESIYRELCADSEEQEGLSSDAED